MTETKRRGRPPKAQSDAVQEKAQEARKAPQTVKMTRDLQPGESGPVSADIHPDEVANMERHGWRKA